MYLIQSWSNTINPLTQRNFPTPVPNHYPSSWHSDMEEWFSNPSSWLQISPYKQTSQAPQNTEHVDTVAHLQTFYDQSHGKAQRWKSEDYRFVVYSATMSTKGHELTTTECEALLHLLDFYNSLS